MVVEDDPINMMLINEVLTKMGFSVIKANNGKKAVEMLQTCRSCVDIHGCEYA